MEVFIQALWGLAAAAVSALAGVAIPAIREWAMTQMALRLGGATGRVAGQLAGQIAVDPALRAATDAMLDAGADLLRERLPGAIAKLRVSDATLRGMVAGELGKLGVRIAPLPGG